MLQLTYYLFVVVVIFGSNGRLFVEGACPDDWMSNAGSCYVIIDQHEDWVRANDVCKLFGGYLAELTTSAENEFAKRFARNKNIGSVWIGGNDILSNGKWMWVTSVQRFSFKDWAPGEPSSAGDKCVQLWSSKNYMWDDEYCGDEKGFICETSPTGETVIG